MVHARRVVAANHGQAQRQGIFHQRQNRRGQLVGDERRRLEKDATDVRVRVRRDGVCHRRYSHRHARWRGFEISDVERGSNRRRRDHFRGDDVED